MFAKPVTAEFFVRVVGSVNSIMYRVGQKTDCFWKFVNPVYVDIE